LLGFDDRDPPNRDSSAFRSARVPIVARRVSFSDALTRLETWSPRAVAFCRGAPHIRLMPPYSYRDDPAVPRFADDKPLIVFDGLCALCSGSAAFVLRHDGQALFRLLPAQSPLGHALYIHYGLDPQNYETMILIQDGVARLRSEAAILIAQGLGFPWSLAAIFRVIPLGLRDRLYMLVARNRIRWFGARTSCYRPDPRFADRMIG
jgi:predicted DCC family thiol-disulfide oxidoreductase YuxK